MVKITVPVRPSPVDPAWPPFPVETLWAESLPDGHFRIDNVPWFTTDMSCDDVVSAVCVANGEPLLFEKVVSRGGHSTFRVRTSLSDDRSHEIFHMLIDAFRKLQCGVEKNNAEFFAIDVPPESSVYGVVELLKKGLEWGVWDFEHGCLPRS